MDKVNTILTISEQMFKNSQGDDESIPVDLENGIQKIPE